MAHASGLMEVGLFLGCHLGQSSFRAHIWTNLEPLLGGGSSLRRRGFWCEGFWEGGRTIMGWCLLPPFGPSQILLVSFPKQLCIPYWSLLLWDNSCKWVSSNLTKAAVSVKGSRTTHPRETSYSRYFLGIGVEVSFLCKYFPLGVGTILPHKRRLPPPNSNWGIPCPKPASEYLGWGKLSVHRNPKNLVSS